MKRLIFVIATFSIVLMSIFMFYRAANNATEPFSLKMIIDYIASYNGFENFRITIKGITVAYSDLNASLQNIFEFNGLLETIADIGIYIGSFFKGGAYLILAFGSFIDFILSTLWWILGFFDLLI